MKNILSLLLITLFMISCGKGIVTYSELDKLIIFNNGEWYSHLDSLNGISIRKHKMAFFKDEKFAGSEVYDYVVIDSISEEGEFKKVIGTYLKMIIPSDTIYHKIIEFNDEKLILKKGDEIEIFSLR